MMKTTNYDLLKYLAADGGYYDCAGHLELLQRAFPENQITMKCIRSVRSSIVNSSFVVSDFHIVQSRQKAFRVISVDPQHEKHAKARTPVSHEKITDSYLRCGHETEIRAIQLRRQFDQLLSGCRGLSQR